uniref:Xylanolytic transcriptional activator regulatory domain-containing protein n=1 Tax=Bionectria ochroleuca TaxID=29856 RepID=A0A0B7KKK0_BIOOC
MRISREAVPVEQLIGTELPPPAVVECLLESFSTSVAWYLSFFHEPSLRARLKGITDAGRARTEDASFLLLVLVVLAIGAQYITAEQKWRHFGFEFDTTDMQDRLIETVETKLLIVLDESSTSSVSLFNLLGSYYIFNRKTRRGFTFMGAAVRVAHMMDLHNESAWGQVDSAERQARRRAWWTLYTGDRFTAQVFGRPAAIQDIDMHVHYNGTDDQGDAAQRGDEDDEAHDDVQRLVDREIYQVYKAKLYQIATPLTRGMQPSKGQATNELIQQVQSVHQQLLEWEKSLPPKLRLQSFEETPFSYSKDSPLSTLNLQALALQASYDNMQLLLHRPLVIGKHLGKPTGTAAEPTNEGFILTSRRQCWSSAMRISYLVKHKAALEFANNTPMGAHIGIHVFTAGVMLAVFALLSPMSNQAQEAKHGLSRLLDILASNQSWNPVLSQSAAILKDLLRLIMEKELKLLVEPNHDRTGSKSSEGDAIASHGLPQTSMPPDQLGSGPSHHNVVAPSPPPSFTSHPHDFGDCFSFLANGSFDEAMSSFQDVFLGDGMSVLDPESNCEADPTWNS